MKRLLIAGGVFFLLLTVIQNHAHSFEKKVQLALVLALDVSSSVNDARFELQRSGYAAAFRSPEVVDAITSAGLPTAVTIVQWASPKQQYQAIDWVALQTGADAEDLSARIQEMPRKFSGSTALGEALYYSAFLIQMMPFAPIRRIIDISGDGQNNDGRRAAVAREHAIARGITINGLPILPTLPTIERVDVFYKEHVIGGPGHFMIVANNYADFGRAIRKKLAAEIAAR